MLFSSSINLNFFVLYLFCIQLLYYYTLNTSGLFHIRICCVLVLSDFFENETRQPSSVRGLVMAW